MACSTSRPGSCPSCATRSISSCVATARAIHRARTSRPSPAAFRSRVMPMKRSRLARARRRRRERPDSTTSKASRLGRALRAPGVIARVRAHVPRRARARAPTHLRSHVSRAASSTCARLRGTLRSSRRSTRQEIDQLFLGVIAQVAEERGRHHRGVIDRQRKRGPLHGPSRRPIAC